MLTSLHHHIKNGYHFWLYFLTIIFPSWKQKLHIKIIYFPIFFIRLLRFLITNKTWETTFLVCFQNAFWGSSVASIISYIIRNLRKYSVNDQTQVIRIDKKDVLYFSSLKKIRTLCWNGWKTVRNCRHFLNGTWWKQGYC